MLHRPLRSCFSLHICHCPYSHRTAPRDKRTRHLYVTGTGGTHTLPLSFSMLVLPRGLLVTYCPISCAATYVHRIHVAAPLTHPKLFVAKLKITSTIIIAKTHLKNTCSSSYDASMNNSPFKNFTNIKHQSKEQKPKNQTKKNATKARESEKFSVAQ